MERWRTSRDQKLTLSAADQAELESLVDAELMASGRRAASVAQELGR